MRRFTLIAVPYAWLLVLFLVPFVIVFKISLSDTALAIPPYTPTLDFSSGWAGIRAFFAGLDFENFTFLTTDDLYWKAYLSSLQIAAISTVLTLLVGYPIAYAMAQSPDEWRPTLMMLVILPFWTIIPDPRLCLDGYPLKRRLPEPVSHLDRRHLRTAHNPEHQYSRLYRHRLYLPALHDPADLRRFGKTRLVSS